MIQLEVLYPSTNRPSPSKELLSVGASVPIATKGKVYVRGRNDMPTSQYLGISWVVKDPDGEVVEEIQDWTGWWPFYKKIGPDDDHEFIGDRFDIDKLGDWTISIGLFMNIEDPVMVDSYDGVLCTTTTEVPPVYTCPYCEATFATKAELDAHIKSDHPEEVEKKFPWTPVIIGAGVVIAIAGLAAAKRR